MLVSNASEVNHLLLTVYGEALTVFTGLGLGDVLTKVAISAVDAEKASQFFELCYANKDDLPGSVIDAAIQIGQYATQCGYYGLSGDGRGLAMLAAMSGGTDGPEPLGQYSPPPPPVVLGSGEGGAP